MADTLALVFDLDGTLIHSAPDIHAAANKVLENNGLGSLPYATVRSFIGNGVESLISRLLGAHGQPTDGDQHARMVREFVSIYEQAHDLTSLYPGVAESLTSLRAAGHALGICTNKPEGPARAVLCHFGLDRHFQVVIGGDTLPTRKPDPAPLRAALGALGDRAALFIGDSEVDAATARAADVPLAIFTEGYRSTPAEALGARIVFDDFHALPGLVAHLAPRLRLKAGAT